jgi:flagellar biosynthesis protein FliR
VLNVTDTQMFAWLAGILLPFFRILGLMSSGPIISNRAFPVRARVALSAVVAIVSAPFIEVPAGVSIVSGDALILIAREVLIGVAIGFIARLTFAAFEIAGEAIGLQMGLSFAGFFDPQSGQSNALGRSLSTFSLLIFTSLNGPLLLIAAVVQSFSVFPIDPGAAVPWDRLAPVAMGADLFAMALSIALPFIALLLFLNLVLGIISRVAPQFNVFVVGFPITIGAGLILFAIGLPLIEQPLLVATERMLQTLGR